MKKQKNNTIILYINHKNNKKSREVKHTYKNTRKYCPGRKCNAKRAFSLFPFVDSRNLCIATIFARSVFSAHAVNFTCARIASPAFAAFSCAHCVACYWLCLLYGSNGFALFVIFSMLQVGGMMIDTYVEKQYLIYFCIELLQVHEGVLYKSLLSLFPSSNIKKVIEINKKKRKI